MAIIAGKIAKKKDVCEAYGFYDAGKTHIWRAKLRYIRETEKDAKLFTGNWLSPKEVRLLIHHMGKPATYVESVS